jgi:hypothetical protein
MSPSDEFTGAGCCEQEDGYLRAQARVREARVREAEALRVALDDVMQRHHVEGRIGFYSSLLDELVSAAMTLSRP